MVKIIGIDPGLASTGVGIISGDGRRIPQFSFGCIATSKKDTLPKRLEQIFSEILLALQAQKPNLLVVEDIFSLKAYPKSGINLGKVTGVILLAGSKMGIPIVELPVREAKRILTGNGNATKNQLEKAVRFLLGLKEPIRPYHASDAVALAIIGMYRYHDNARKSP